MLLGRDFNISFMFVKNLLVFRICIIDIVRYIDFVREIRYLYNFKYRFDILSKSYILLL